LETEFQIAITTSELLKMEHESVPDYNKNAIGENIYMCQKLQGSWMSCMRLKINEYEQTNYSIIGK
jgi:hypothetical protein